ncbi:MAG: DUF192 domain-containing protein [Phycisphaeraceae bacterium]|nr:DUF192 domain-containing protein [Phycisphaeraceae bacterium]MCW5754211.1 DUF192 domain-containing protein [Phycisphaeraceae bacterium]
MALHIVTMASALMLGAITPVAIVGCAPASSAPVADGRERVTLGGKTFLLELAADDATRVRGLSGRDEIAADGGMLFVFPRSQRLEFVMRDCLVDIDIIFVDGTGRITAMHEMKVEPPRREDEPKTDDPRLDRYEARLPRYSSRYDAQFAIELRGGTIATLSPRPEAGERVNLDVVRLKRLAR